MTVQDFINTTGISEATLSKILEYKDPSEEFTLSNLAEIGIYLERKKEDSLKYAKP